MDPSVTVPTPGLELASDRPFERRFWLTQRIVWAVLDGLLLAAVAGLLGQGPLGKASSPSAAPMVVTYEWITRAKAPAMIEVLLKAEALKPGKTMIRLDQALLDAFSIEAIRPEPLIWQAVGNGIRLFMATDPAPAPATIKLRMKALRPGLVNGAVAVEGQPPVPLRILILP